MKIEDLFKRYLEEDEYDDGYDDEEDDNLGNGEDDDDEDEDDSVDDDDIDDDDQDDQDDQNDKNDDRKDNKKDDKDRDDKNKNENQQGEEQKVKDNVDNNVDNKNIDEKAQEVKDKEGDGSKGHTTSEGENAGNNPKSPAEPGQEGGATGSGEKAAEGGAKTGEKATEGGAKTGEKAAEGGAKVGEKAAEEGVKTGGKTVGETAAVGETATTATTAGGTAATTASGTAATTAAGGTATTAAGGSAAGGGLASAFAATLPWSLIVLLIIIIIIIIILIVSFFQTLPGVVLENLKRSVKQWVLNVLENTAETFGLEDRTISISSDQVQDLAQYITDMGYDIQTYGFGDIKVKAPGSSREELETEVEDEIKTKPNRVDKEVIDDGTTNKDQIKSKYLKAYLAADECTYHFRETNWIKDLFGFEAQQGLINPLTKGGLLFNTDEDKLEIDRESETLKVYNKSLDIPVIGFWKKIFTGSRAFKWGSIISYDINTWIGRYKRPVELFLALHLATMMPDIPYQIATKNEFNTEVDVAFERIRICLKGNLEAGTGKDAYIREKETVYTARQIIADYLDLFEIKKGIFDSEATNQEEREFWEDFRQSDITSKEQLWYVFTNLYEKFNDIENFFVEIWNWLIDWKYIKIGDAYQFLTEQRWIFKENINVEEDSALRDYPGFYEYFDCDERKLGSAKYPDKELEYYNKHPSKEKKKGKKIASGKFELEDLETMIEIWNSDPDNEDKIADLYDSGHKWNGDSDPELEIAHVDEGVRLKFKEGIDLENDEEVQEKVIRAYLVYRFGTEDIMFEDDGFLQGDQGGVDDMLWPFVTDVKNHWYYKDIDFLGSDVEPDKATYRLARKGYKTIFYSNDDHETFEIPCALYPDKDSDWNYLVYQVAEPKVEAPNENIKKVFRGQYYCYDGTHETAQAIANSRALEEILGFSGKTSEELEEYLNDEENEGEIKNKIKDKKYYYNGDKYDVEKEKWVKKEQLELKDPATTLQALAIVENMHSVASDYIYRDLKDLFVKLDFYSKEDMTEDLKLMMMWPIYCDNKNTTFTLAETHNSFGKAIVGVGGRTVLAPMDGQLKISTDATGGRGRGYVIEVGELNSDHAKLLEWIFKNDYYKINKEALKGLKIHIAGFKLDEDLEKLLHDDLEAKGDEEKGIRVRRGNPIGTVIGDSGKGKLEITILKEDNTVVEDLAEYMRQDHNNKYEEIMEKRMNNEGTKEAIPLRKGDRDGFDSVSNRSSDLSISRYSNTRENVGLNDEEVLQTAKAVYKSMKDAGYSDEQIAGTLGNIYAESGVRSNNLENGYANGWGISDSEYTSRVDNGTWVSTAFDHRNPDTGKGYHSEAGNTFTSDYGGYGLCQWTTPGRKANLKNKADAQGVSVSDVNIQTELLKEELANVGTWAGHSDSMNAFINPGSGESGVMLATKAFCLGFERPGDPEGSMQRRIGAALTFYDKIKDGTLASS